MTLAKRPERKSYRASEGDCGCRRRGRPVGEVEDAGAEGLRLVNAVRSKDGTTIPASCSGSDGRFGGIVRFGRREDAPTRSLNAGD
jgi:hypothetical protein